MITIANLLRAAALACVTVAPAIAAEPVRHTATVYVGDLNLASEAGKAEMHQRLRLAIRKVCPTGMTAISQDFVNCRRGAKASANLQASQAIAAYEARQGNQLASR